MEINVSSVKGGDVCPLADLRPLVVSVMKGIAIGISPMDSVLNKMTHKEINKIIKSVFSRRHIPFCLVGEWSPTNHRWHYHGFCEIMDFKKLDGLKRRLNGVVGRTVTEQVRYHNDYVNYMFKIYTKPILLETIQPFQFDSIVTNINEIHEFISKAEREQLCEPSDADRRPGE